MMSKAQLKKAKLFKTQLLWLGIILLPAGGLGIIFLMMYSEMKDIISKEEKLRGK